MGKAEVDLAKALRLRETHLIKRVVSTKYGTTVELHDPVASLKLLGQHNRMWREIQEHTVTVDPESARAEFEARMARIVEAIQADRALKQAAGPSAAGLPGPGADGAAE